MMPLKQLCLISLLALGSTACQQSNNPSNNQSKSQSDNQTESKLVEQVTPAIKINSDQMMAHLQAFQNIAQKYDGNRAVGTQGGQASAQYIIEQAKKLGFTAQILAFENREKTKGQNIVVEITGKNKDAAIIVGAHYDSVKNGPGINDNASGVAVLLELMQHYAQNKTPPQQNIILAFWDSEEVGIAGSAAYVEKLTTSQIQGIKAYINLDMVGTKQPQVLIADADKSSVDELEEMLKQQDPNNAEFNALIAGLRAIPSHPNDVILEKHLKSYAQKHGLDIKEDVSTLTASDTLPFLGKVPVSSIIMFNEQMKGDVLEFAPCYHQACDTIDLVDPKSLIFATEATLHLIDVVEKN